MLAVGVPSSILQFTLHYTQFNPFFFNLQYELTFIRNYSNTYISQNPRQGNCAKKLNPMIFRNIFFILRWLDTALFLINSVWFESTSCYSKLIIRWKIKLCFYFAVFFIVMFTKGTFSEFQSIIYEPVTSLFEGEWDHCELQIHRTNSGWRKLSHD